MKIFLELLPIGFLICLFYVPLSYLYAFFFEGSAIVNRRTIHSLLYAALIYLVVALVVWMFPNVWWGNRLQHAFGGGFLAYFICYRVVQDLGIRIDHDKFFLFSVLVVTTLGVGNEIMEFILQTVTGHIFSPTTTDTWLDLASNTVGLLTASLIFRPKARHNEQTRRIGAPVR